LRLSRKQDHLPLQDLSVLSPAVPSLAALFQASQFFSVRARRRQGAVGQESVRRVRRYVRANGDRCTPRARRRPAPVPSVWDQGCRRQDLRVPVPVPAVPRAAQASAMFRAG